MVPGLLQYIQRAPVRNPRMWGLEWNLSLGVSVAFL